MGDLDDSRPLPWVPGEGPFRIKGVAYRGHLQYVAEHVPGGVEEMLAGLRDRRVAEFFETAFLSGSFYDIGPLVMAGYVCARQARKTFHDFLRVRSRFQAEKDVGGIYRVLLKLASPTMVITRLPALQSQYLDFPGGGRAEIVEKRHALLTRQSLPTMLATWFTVVNETYVDVALTAAGARTVISRSTTEPDAPTNGFPAVKYTCDVTWH